MAHNYFECSIRFEKMMENGMNKKVTERYLVDALSFTEAEARIIEEMRELINGEFAVKGITPAKYAEVVLHDGAEEEEGFWSVKLGFFTLDKRTGVEKITPVAVLVQADTVETANQRIREHMKNTMFDYRIVTVKETSIVDVFNYEAPDYRQE